MNEQLYPRLPGSVELDSDAKKRVVAAVKTVLTRLQQKGAVEAGDYSAVLASPVKLHAFIEAFMADRAVAADLLVDGRGRPVTDEDGKLSCGLSLAQIGQMLVFTAAKRIFTEAEPARPAAPAAPAKTGLFGRATPAAAPKQTEGERKLAALKDLIAFPWQLPLLKLYYFLLDPQLITELGRDILLLQDIGKLEAAAGIRPEHVRAVRKVIGDDFAEMLLARPEAAIALSETPSALYPLLREVAGERVWDLYARGRDYVMMVAELERSRMFVIGPLIADLAPESLRAIRFVELEKLAPLLDGFKTVFGDDAALLLGDPAFAGQTLSALIKAFEALPGDAADFGTLVELKCTAVKAGLAPYIARLRAAQGLPT